MSVVDPRELGDRELLELGDRQLLVYLLLGDLPRPGWPGRRRAVARRMLEVAVTTLLFVLILLAFLGLVVLVWAGTQPA